MRGWEHGAVPLRSQHLGLWIELETEDGLSEQK